MTETQNGGTARSHYLLDGRRVTLSDLVEGGLLPVGSTLTFVRPRRGETFCAEVTADGGVLLADGQEFRSPSRAALVASGMRSVDGWYAWVVDSSGRLLDSLRQELLDQVVTELDENSDEGEGDVSVLERRHELLKAARKSADANNPMEISVRDLLARWSAKARGQRISQQIEADLANHGLITSPNFRKVTPDATVQLVNVASEEFDTPDAEPSDMDDAETPDSGLTLGNLPSALGGVVSVGSNATFEEAITSMLLNDYSQLAVLDGRCTLRGAVTWKSIAQIRHSNPSASFADAIVPADDFRYDKELIDALPTLETTDFIFVRDEKNTVSGIVTSADVVHAYGGLATPFLLIGELDQLLRRLIYRTFDLEEVMSLCGPRSQSLRSFDDLAFGDYRCVLENNASWAKLGWPLHRPTFVKRLDELRQLRNDIMHFNPDPVPVDAVDKLRNFIKLLHKYGD